MSTKTLQSKGNLVKIRNRNISVITIQLGFLSFKLINMKPQKCTTLDL